MSGAGNDFILIDKKFNPEIELTPQLIKKFCERRSGIGGDGVIVLSDKNGFAFEMNYFNADGTTGSLCANGARCAVLYGKQSGRLTNETAIFLANQVQYSGKILDDNKIKFFLNSPKKLKFNFKIKAAEQLINASFADTGSPHVVIKIQDVLKDRKNLKSFYTDLNDFPVIQLGREIRYHKDFAPEGTNVNFIDISGDVIKIRSYERGVEDETLSCGTGSVAAALTAFTNYHLQPPVKLFAKSGDELVVDFKIENNKVQELSLTGPAVVTFKGEITI